MDESTSLIAQGAEARWDRAMRALATAEEATSDALVAFRRNRSADARKALSECLRVKQTARESLRLLMHEISVNLK